MSANLQDTRNDMEKKLQEQKTAKEKAVSVLEQKTSEAIALRSLLKQCQSALESVSFCPTTTIDEDPSHGCRREDHGYVAAIKPNPILTSADNGMNSVEKELKSTLIDPPCTSTKDPPTEELLLSVRSLDYTSSSIETLVPHEIGVDLYSNHNSSEEAPLPMQELQLNAANTSHQVGGAPEPSPSEIQNDEKKLSAETSPTTTNTTSKDETQTTTEEEPIELQKGGSSSSSSKSRINKSMESESTNGTDDYSMGSFHSLKSHKKDEKGRVQYLHIL